jgi:hypothetical protein
LPIAIVSLAASAVTIIAALLAHLLAAAGLVSFLAILVAVPAGCTAFGIGASSPRPLERVAAILSFVLSLAIMVTLAVILVASFEMGD